MIRTSQVLEQLETFAGSRILFSSRNDDYVKVTFRSEPADDFQFRAFLYDEGGLEINARLKGDNSPLWSYPFELVDFDKNESAQWHRFSAVLEQFFTHASRIHIEVALATVSTVCTVVSPNGELNRVGATSYLKVTSDARRLLQSKSLTWNASPIPAM